MRSSEPEQKAGREEQGDSLARLRTKLERLERLVVLHRRGALTDEEFEAERRLLLSSP